MIDIFPGVLLASKDDHFTAVVISVSIGDMVALSTLSVIVCARGGPYSSGFFQEWCATSMVQLLAADGELIIVPAPGHDDLPAPGSSAGPRETKTQ